MTALNFPPSPTDGEIFGNYRWDDTIGVWRLLPENFPIVVEDLSDLNDVSITGPISGESLVYDGSDWVNKIPPIFETEEKTVDYTLALADSGLVVQMNKSGAATLTIPTNASVAFPIGTIVGVYNRSSDAVTVVGAAGVTVRNDGAVGQFAEASLRKRATDEWVMVGG